MQFYILDGQEQTGPFSSDEVGQKIQIGECAADTLAWHDGLTEWQPLAVLLPEAIHQQVESASLSVAPVLSLPPPLPPSRNEAVKLNWYDYNLVIFPALLCCFPFGFIPLWLTKKFEKPVKVGLAVAILFGYAACLSVFGALSRGAPENAHGATEAITLRQDISADDRIVLRGTTLYSDRQTVEIIQTEWDKGERTGKAASERLLNEKKVWTAPYDIRVKVLESGGPMGAQLVEDKNGGSELKGKQFWVMRDAALPMSNRAAKWASDESKAVSKGRFEYVLDGKRTEHIGSTQVAEFLDFVSALYNGEIRDSEARKVLIMPECLSGNGNYPCELDQVLENHLIYEGVLTIRQHVQLALLRNPDFEAQFVGKGAYANANALYADIKRSRYHSADPLNSGAFIYVGMSEFTTKVGGFVRAIPVFRMVNVQP